MSAPLPKADVVIVGLGAAGGIAAHVLTQAGINVVGIEAGPALTLVDFLTHLDELDGIRNWSGEPKYNKEIPTWRPDAASPTTSPLVPAVRMANMVGGTTVHYGAQSWRMRADDFKARTTTVERYGEGAIPASSTLADWPLSYEELEPYYDQVEYLIGVSGKAGNLNGQITDGGNPFESPRARDYPLPPLQGTGLEEIAAEGMRSLGYHPFPSPAAILSEGFDGRPACSYCGFCASGYGCWNDSKSSTLVSAIRKAEATGKLEIRARSPASSTSTRMGSFRSNRRRSSSSPVTSTRTIGSFSSRPPISIKTDWPTTAARLASITSRTSTPPATASSPGSGSTSMAGRVSR